MTKLQNVCVVPSFALGTVGLNVVPLVDLFQHGVVVPSSEVVQNTIVGVFLDVLSPIAWVLGVGYGADFPNWQKATRKVEDGWKSVK